MWLTGVTGPVAPAAGQTVPEFVSVSAGNGLQQRTLVLSAAGSRVSYSLLRGSSPSMADPDLIPAPAAQQALSAAVTTLVAPGGGGVVDQSQSLAHFDIGFADQIYILQRLCAEFEQSDSQAITLSRFVLRDVVESL